MMTRTDQAYAKLSTTRQLQSTLREKHGDLFIGERTEVHTRRDFGLPAPRYWQG